MKAWGGLIVSFVLFFGLMSFLSYQLRLQGWDGGAVFTLFLILIVTVWIGSILRHQFGFRIVDFVVAGSLFILSVASSWLLSHIAALTLHIPAITWPLALIYLVVSFLPLVSLLLFLLHIGLARRRMLKQRAAAGNLQNTTEIKSLKDQF